MCQVSKKFISPGKIFARLEEKHNGWENSEKILKFLNKNSIEKLIFY